MAHRLATAACLVLLASAASAQTPRTAPSLVLTNARAATAVAVTIAGEGATATSINGPIEPGRSTTLKLPRYKTCLVSVTASFDDEAEIALDGFDLCKEKTIRFVD
jgi:hypothetical protein